MTDVKRPFQVDGKPFFTLGGQSRNSSGYNRAEAETAFKALDLLHGNTLEIPVYWEQVEPEEGTFDFSSVDDLLALAEEHDKKLVLLWFGTWKNGNMEYTPAWVKENPDRFWRVTNMYGNTVWVLSSHCPATFEADRKAFSKFVTYLRENDEDRRVISVQIENEPGILGSDRDYGEAAEKAFQEPVPQAVLDGLKTLQDGPVYKAWQEAGAKTSGSWPELFGNEAGEFMTAWHIGSYINKLADAGKAIYDLPMYVNVWLGEQRWRLPGESYPSGGAVGKTLDIYKWATPDIDLIAPDIYIADSEGYREICDIYARKDNPLFVPESAPWGSNAWNMFYALADYNAVGYHFFAIEHIVGEDGEVNPAAEMIVESFHSVAAAIPLLLKYQGTDQIHSVVQEENMASQSLDFDGWIGLARFGYGTPGYVGRDWRHPPKRMPHALADESSRGRGLIFQSDRNEFYLVGGAYQLLLRRKGEPKEMLDISRNNDFHLSRLSNYVSVEEGHFDDEGQFVVDRRRNGDETDHGVWVEPDVGVVRVRLCD